MKRFHVHVGVDDIEQSVQFYSKLFGGAPVKREPDYAKWMLEDPRINFASGNRKPAPINMRAESVRCGAPGSTCC